MPDLKPSSKPLATRPWSAPCREASGTGKPVWFRKSRIGEFDGPEEYLFGSLWSIAVDEDWNVYAFDEQAQHVRVFDSDGAYVETLGGAR